MLISEYIEGQSLYDVIREIGLLSTTDCQFYVACIITILEYFMKEEIVIRDLKPDNFIIDQRGYLNLVSLGSSKYIG
jgi:cGMP-dependent protein kinase